MSAVKVSDVKNYLTGFYGHINEDEGILFGVPSAQVKKVQVCWMADIPAIKNAVSIGADLIVTHEALFYQNKP